MMFEYAESSKQTIAEANIIMQIDKSRRFSNVVESVSILSGH